MPSIFFSENGLSHTFFFSLLNLSTVSLGSLKVTRRPSSNSLTLICTTLSLQEQDEQACLWSTLQINHTTDAN